MTPVGFELTPFRNGALSHRLRPLGQSVLICDQILTWMSAIPIDYVICTHTKNILDFSGQAPTRLRPWPVWLSLLQHMLQPYLTLVDAVWLQPRPKVLPHFAASLVQLMPRNAKCRWPARRGNICFCHCHRAQWMQRQPSAKAKSAFPLGSKSSALDALECPAQMAHTPAQHVFCHDHHAQWMQPAASVHK